MKYMLDTDTCIYLIRKKASGILERIKTSMDMGLAISSITLAELEHGVAKSGNPQRNADALIQMLSIIDVMPFDSIAASEYGQIRTDLEQKGAVIDNLDMLIAAHAKSRNLILVTGNTREFKRVKGLEVENWV